MKQSLMAQAGRCLFEPDAAAKCAATKALYDAWLRGEFAVLHGSDPMPAEQVGRPAQPVLVPLGQLPRRRLQTDEGHRAFIHALAHIEFNAINLALDAVYRFSGLPSDYYGDWLQVAVEEAEHFQLLRGRLRALDCDYGDYPGHDGLWSAAQRTAHDPLVRMALVPRVLEARGLDVAPEMIERLEAIGDCDSADVLRVILRDEVGHVACGSRWFRYLCDQRGCAPDATYTALLREYEMGARGRGAMHYEARRAAGFSEAELAYLGGDGG